MKLKDEKEDDDFKKLYNTFNIMTQEIKIQKNKITLQRDIRLGGSGQAFGT